MAAAMSGPWRPCQVMPTSARVRAAAADVVRFEALRFGGIATAMLVAQQGSPVLHGVASLDVGTGTPLPPTWRSAVAEWPLARAGSQGLPWLLPSADLSEGLRVHGAETVLALPLIDAGAIVGMVIVWLDGTAVHHLLFRADVWQARGFVDARPLLAAQRLDDAQRRLAEIERKHDGERIIEQAKGVLAAHLQTTPDDALAQLRLYCRRRGLRLHVTAQAIVGAAIVGRLPRVLRRQEAGTHLTPEGQPGAPPVSPHRPRTGEADRGAAGVS